MRPRVIVLLVLVLLILGAGAYVLVNYTNNGLNDTTAKAAFESSPAQMPDSTQETSASAEAASTGTVSENTAADRTSAAGDTRQATVDGQTQKQVSTGDAADLQITAVGDIMLGRGVGMRLQKAGSYEKAFTDVSALLKQGDIVFANLESPLTSNTHCLDKRGKIVLRAKPEAVSALTSAGFNLVSIANNHMLDYYEKGLLDTTSTLDANKILHAGGGKNINDARKPAIIERKGHKIGLLAYTDMAELIFAGKPYLSFAAGTDKPGVVPRKYETIREDIQKLRSQVDLVAVSLHWGVEESFTITPEQVEFAHKLIDDGADIILGHHPHQFQGMEVYKGKPILYSMGNFLFDQNDPENMESFIVEMKYKGTELSDFSAIPVRILNKSTVAVQTGSNAENILQRQTELCRKLGMNPVSKNDRIVFMSDGKEQLP